MKGFRRPAGGEIHEFAELDIDGQASPMRQEIVRGPVAPHEGLWIFGFSLWVSQCLPMGNNGCPNGEGWTSGHFAWWRNCMAAGMPFLEGWRSAWRMTHLRPAEAPLSHRVHRARASSR